MKSSLDNFIRTDKSSNDKQCICFGISRSMNPERIRSQIGEVNGGIAIICFDGEMSCFINGIAVRMRRGNITTFLSGDMFSVDSMSDDFRGFVIIVSQYYIINVDAHVSVTYFIHSRFNPMMILPVKDIAVLEALCTRLETFTRETPMPYFSEIMQCVIMIVLYVLCGMYENMPQTGRVGHFRDEELFIEFIHLVEASCRRERMLGYYAQRLSITPKHLSSSVKRISGHSGAEWIDYMVVQNIKRTLKTSSMTISQVADYYNFPNSSFFGKYFKKHTGMTPRRFKATQ